MPARWCLTIRESAAALLLFTLVNIALGLAPADTSSAAEILASVRRATGGDAWDQFGECESEGTITVAGKTGTLNYAEDLRTGANVARLNIPDLWVKQASGVAPNLNWRQDDAGDIRLLPSGDPWQIDDLYLTSHGYWRPDFGGAAIKVLEPSLEMGATYDRLQIQVPGGHGFTLWINRATHLIERIAGDSTKYLSDYRPVEGVLLPFSDRRGKDGQEQVVAMVKRTLLKHVSEAAFAIPFHKDYEMPPSGVVTVPAQSGIIFQARIDGRGPYQVMFDTGSVNLMSANLAKQLGLRLESSMLKFGAGGGTIDTQTTHVDTLQIGSLVVHDQTFYVIASPADAGDTPLAAVGYELMRRFAVKTDYEHEQLTFYNGPSFAYSGNGTEVPLLIDGRVFAVNGSVDGVSGVFVLDTGNAFGFELESGFVKQNDLIKLLGARYHGYAGRGYAGPLAESHYARVRTLQMGGAKVNDVIAYLATGEPAAGEKAGNIGRSVLRQFNITFDCMRGHLYLEKNANWGKPGVFNRAGIVIDPMEQGQKVMTVLPGSPGAIAGLAVGDIITGIDGQPPGDDSEEPAFLQPVGTVLHLTVKHGEEVRKLDVKLKDVL